MIDLPTAGTCAGFITRLYGEIDLVDAGGFLLGAGDTDRELAGRCPLADMTGS